MNNFLILKTALQGIWGKVFDGASVYDQPGDDELFERAVVQVTDTKIKIRITHFSWFTSILSYLTGSETMQMELLPFMHPPQVKDKDLVRFTVYAVREDQSQVL